MESAQKPAGAVTVLPPEPNAKRGRGRPTGSQDKLNRTIREMIVEALNRTGRSLGGEDATAYFELMAIVEPKAMLALASRIVPVQLDATVTQHTPIERIERVVVRPDPVAHAPGVVVPLKRA